MVGNIDIGGRSLRVAWWTLFALVLAAVITARIHLLAVPLERDEGEYAYAGQLMLQGIPPYKLAYNMKFPGTYAAYAAMMWLFGQTIAGIHIGLFLVNFATIVLVFLLAKHLIGTVSGIASAAAYAVLSVSPSVLGFAAHATHFIVLPVLAGTYLLLRSFERPATKALFASGMLFGIAILMKQSAIFFLLFGASYLLLRDWRAKLTLKSVFWRFVLFSCGAILPLGMTFGFLWNAGVFGTFWFWTIKYAREYASLLSIADGLRILRQSGRAIIGSDWTLWVIGPVGLGFALWNRKTRSIGLTFFCPFLLCSALAVCPGFYFRQHYFVQLLPVLSLLAGAAAALVPFAGRSTSLRWIALLGFAVAISFPLWQDREFFFRLSPATASRNAYGFNPFPQAIRVAEFLRQRTSPEDRIAVLGSEPEIYFYSHRHSATGYIYTYGLMEPQPYAADMQREMIREIEAARPKYFVLVGCQTSWLRRTNSQDIIFDWFNRYASENLTGVGLVNDITLQRIDYYLPYNGEAVELFSNYILIYERKL